MSYDIHLNDPVTKQTIELENPHFMRGGTYAIDVTKELSLNITYNYACIFCRHGVLGKKRHPKHLRENRSREHPRFAKGN